MAKKANPPSDMASDILGAIRECTKKWAKTVKAEERSPASRSFRMSRLTRERVTSFKDAAAQIMERAYLQASGNGALAATLLARAEEEDAYEDALDAASNAVVDLVRAAKLDEAEAAARDLLLRFPDVHDGWDRLGMVHEARGNSQQAANCYRKVIDFIRDHPDRYDASMAEQFTRLVDRLDPPTAT
jgi:tetratricopeptide (TPR) repeat protein